MSINGNALPPDRDQRDLIDNALERCLLVEAAAGTGKTTKMVDRLLGLLSNGCCEVENIAAVTFTRKAAAELRGRFVAELERRASSCNDPALRQRLARSLENLDRAFIGTIHSFCARLLRERPVEAGVRVGFEEADEETDAELRAEAWQLYLSGLYAEGDDSLDRLDELGLEPAALERAYQTLCRFGDLDDSCWPAPETPLPDSAALVEVLRGYSAHMASLELPDDPGNDKLIPAYRLVPRLVRLLDLGRPAGLAEALEVFKPLKLVHYVWPGKKEQALREWERWEAFRNEFAAPWLSRWLAHRYPAALRFALAGRKVYQELLNERGLLSYQDLLCRAAALLRSNARVRRYFRARFSHVLVDEFQDTDPLQAEVLLLLTAADPEETDWRRCVPVPGSLFVVGDPKQSIYRFRRADIVTYNQVRARIEAAGGMVVSLSANFRTDPDLIEWINGSFHKAFEERTGPCSPDWMPLQPGRFPETCGELSGVRALRFEKDVRQVTRVETVHLARFIRQALDRGLTLPRTARQLERGVPLKAGPGDFLIITRNRNHLREFASALEGHGLPCAVTGGGALDQVEELKLLHLILAALLRPDDPVRLVAALRSAAFGVSDRELYAFVRAGGKFNYRETLPQKLSPELTEVFRGVFGCLRECAEWLGRLTPTAAFQRIAVRLGLFASAAARPGGDIHAGSLARALELVRAASAGQNGLTALVERLGELASGARQEESLSALGSGGPAVRLMNLHQAKGLEAPVVILADPFGENQSAPEVYVDREGDSPRGYLTVSESLGQFGSRLLACHESWEIFASREKEHLEAERLRLLYVAATRAGSMLVITQRASRNNLNPWSFFADSLEGCETIPLYGPPDIVESAPEPVRLDPDAGGREIEAAWNRAALQSYSIITAREKAGMAQEVKTGRADGDGREFGSLVHLLLQTHLVNPEAGLRDLALTALREQDMDPARLESALETVRAVAGSDIWRRARSAQVQMAEVPFETLDPESTLEHPVIIRGQIDLVFRESGGWVIVDYKTDKPGPEGYETLERQYAPQVRLYAELWERMTGETVSECGLFFTSGGIYSKIEFMSPT